MCLLRITKTEAGHQLFGYMKNPPPFPAAVFQSSQT
jgi:hypothetical protein